MAKKIKKASKKAVAPKRTTGKHHHRWEHHDFLLVVAGGFVVIVLIFLLSDSFRASVGSLKGPEKQSAVNALEAKNQMEKIISIEEFSYSDNPLTVKKGTTVTWTNKDAETHSATADDGSFNTGVLAEGESGSVTFNDVGKHTYHCSTHPNMTGMIIVEE